MAGPYALVHWLRQIADEAERLSDGNSAEIAAPSSSPHSELYWLAKILAHLRGIELGEGGGSGSYLPLAGGAMDPGAQISWENGSIDREIPGDPSVGREIICSVGYRWQWRAGRMRLLNLSDQVVRIIAVDAPPGANDDETSGVIEGTVYETADGNLWVCDDPSVGDAVWSPWQIPDANIPAIAVTEYLGTAASQAAMLMIVGQKGDWIVRTDEGKVYVITGNDTTSLLSWTALTYPAMTQTQWDALLSTSTAFSSALTGKLNTSAVSAFILTLLDDADAAAAAGTLGMQRLVRQTFSDANVTVTAGTTFLAQTGTVTAARTVTLPAASAYSAGAILTIADEGSLGIFWLVISRAGSDTISWPGATGQTSFRLRTTGGAVRMASNGSNAWKCLDVPHLAVTQLDGINGGLQYNSTNPIFFASGIRLTGTGLVATESVSVGCSANNSSLTLTASGTGSIRTSAHQLDLAVCASAGVPPAGFARLVTLLVGGVNELHAVDGSGNVTQLSAHTATAPAWMYPDGQPSGAAPIAPEWNLYTGIVTYRNRHTGAVYQETFAEHNTRLELTGDRALVVLDWDTVQAQHVAAAQAARDEWTAAREAWELIPEDERPEWLAGEIPPAYTAMPRPDWATDQSSAILAGRAVEAVEASYRQTIAEGYDTGNGYSLGMTKDDQLNWTGLLTGYKAGEDAGAITPQSPVAFRDRDGNPRQATLHEFRLMMWGVTQAVVAADAARAQALAGL